MAKIYTTIGPVRKNIFAHKYLVRNYVSQGWFLGQECRDIVLLCFDVQMWLKSVRSHACLKTASRYDVVCAAAAVVAPRQKYGKVGSSSSHITWVGRRLDQSEPDITGHTANQSPEWTGISPTAAATATGTVTGP